jgi:hypothetical protein
MLMQPLARNLSLQLMLPVLQQVLSLMEILVTGLAKQLLAQLHLLMINKSLPICRFREMQSVLQLLLEHKKMMPLQVSRQVWSRLMLI